MNFKAGFFKKRVLVLIKFNSNGRGERGTPDCGICRSGGRLGDENKVVNAEAVMG